MWKLKLKDETEIIINEGACVDEFTTEETDIKNKLTDDNLSAFEIQNEDGEILAIIDNMTLSDILEENGVFTVKLVRIETILWQTIKDLRDTVDMMMLEDLGVE